MAVNVNCPGCRTSYPVTEDLLGKTIRCKKCQETFTATAAKSAVASRASDERITTRAPAKRDNPRYDDEDDAPRRNGNGRGRPTAKRPAAKSGNKGLLIGGIAGGVLLLAAGVGLGVWILNKDDGSTTDNPPVVNNTPPISTGTPVADPTPAPKGDPDKEKAAANGGATNPSMKTAPPIPKFRPARIDREVLKRVEKSAVLIRVTTQEGISEGSGWFAEPGIVVTNSHVVGMKEAAKPPPERIEVFIYSGDTANEEKLTGELLAIDRDEDLAVIRVKGKHLPPPLTVVPSSDLRNGEKLYIMGFPLGSGIMDKMGLSKSTLVTVKTREAPVAGRILYKDGSVKYIQTEGGADHGNSGGACLDANGNVAAVLVAGLGDWNSNMRFVIPSEYATYLLQGRILRVIPGQAFASAAGINQPIAIQIADPLKRIRKVSIDVWAGKPGKIRPAATVQPTPQEGDGPRATLDLAYDPDQRVELGASLVAKGEIALPALQPNEVYWFQPHYVSKEEKDRWGEAVVMEMGRYPVEQKSANLAVKYKDGQVHQLELRSQAEFSYALQGRGGHIDLDLTANLMEKVQKVEKNGEAKVRLKYNTLKMSDPTEDSLFRKELRGVMEQVKNLAADVTMTPDGVIKHFKEDFANVPDGARPVLKIFNQQILESLDAAAVSLPNKDVQPGESWEADVNYTIDVGRQVQNALFHTKYTYLGTRTRDGRQEAVVTIEGRIVRNSSDSSTSSGRPARGSRGEPGQTPAPPPGGPPAGGDEGDDPKTARHGFNFGAAAVDLATGQVILSRNLSEMALEIPIADNVKALAAGAMDLTLRRTGTPPPKAVPGVKAPSIDELLPGLPKAYNPLVTEDADSGASEAFTPPPFDPALSAAERLSPELNRKVEKATVWIHVSRGEQASTGSGWFAEPNGIIITNSHVVGMKDKAARPPDSVDIILDAGLPTMRKYPAKILALDRFEDLCVLKIDAPDLPEPLPILPSEGLGKSDPLFVSGFSRGNQPVKILKDKLNELLVTVKIRPTTVGGTIERKDGTRQYVVIEAGADPGNSGGPIVDTKGRVRAVLVAGYAEVLKSMLVFSIPSEYPARMLQGYPMEVHTDRAYLKGSIPTQPVEIKFSDPVKRVKKVAIDYWVGNKGATPRRATDKTPKTATGDDPHQTIELAYNPDTQTATGEFSLPDLTSGRVIWLQPRFTNGTGKEQWSPTEILEPDGPPVDRTQAVMLAIKHKANTRRDIELVTLTDIHFSLFGQAARLGSPFKAILTEIVTNVFAKTGTARMQLVYQSLELDLKKIIPGLEGAPPGLEAALSAQLRPLLSLIRGVITLVDVTKDGHMKMVRNGLSYANVPAPLQEQMAKFNTQVLASLQALTFPLPNKTVKYGDTWEFPTDLFIPSRSKVEGALFHMKMKYIGVRTRGGRREAIIDITGALSGKSDAKGLEMANATPVQEQSGLLQAPAGVDAASAKKGLYGDAHGYAFVDVDGGYVAEVKLFIDLEVEMMVKDPKTKQDVPVDAGGTMELHLWRRSAQTTK